MTWRDHSCIGLCQSGYPSVPPSRAQPHIFLLVDRYYVEVGPCDVQAVLENHTHIEDIDITRLPLLASSQDEDSLEPPQTPSKADRG